MSKEELASWLRALGEPTYRGRQIAGWLYDRGARDFAEMTDLPTALRRQLGSAGEATVRDMTTGDQRRVALDRLAEELRR